MVHVLAAHRAEASDDGSRWTQRFDGPAAGMRASDGFGEVDLRIVVALRNVAHEAALADGLVNRRPDTSSEPAQSASGGTMGIAHGRTSAAAGALRYAPLVAERSIGTHGRALKPRLVVELTCLHMKADSHEACVANGVGGRTSAVATAKVAHGAVVRQDEDVAAIAVAVLVAVVIMIPIVILRHGSRG